MAFDATGTLVAVAVNADVAVVQVSSCREFVHLEGHQAKITQLKFHPHKPPILFTASEDRTFKVMVKKAPISHTAGLGSFRAMHGVPVPGAVVEFDFDDQC